MLKQGKRVASLPFTATVQLDKSSQLASVTAQSNKNSLQYLKGITK